MYITKLKQALESINKMAVENATSAIKNAPMVYTCGNGGSAATAVHFAGDLSKNINRPAICLSDNLTSFTAYANDDGYRNALAYRLKQIGNPGDVLVAISTSGNSKNIVRAANVALSKGIVVIGLTSAYNSKLFKMADIVLNVRTDTIEIAEDCHMAICHNIVWNLKQKI